MNILYVQPYVPHYRKPLFEAIGDRLRKVGGSLTVACSAPRGAQAARADMAAEPWMLEVPGHIWSTPVGEFKFRRRLRSLLRRMDLCVMELDAGNINAWLHVSTSDTVPIVLWGHGKSFTSPSNRVLDSLRIKLAKRARHIMTYSPAGRAHLINGGVQPSRVTSVGNATDTVRLRRLLESRLRRRTDVSEAFDISVAGLNLACYIGGLDTDKRVSFLVSAAIAAHRLDPSFRLLVAGSGIDQHLLRRAGPAIAWIPRAEESHVADMAAIARCIWMPGRVGLIAIDALALGRPVLTTPFRFHAPEYEFLRSGESVHVLSDSPATFAQQALTIKELLPIRPLPPDNSAPTIASVTEAMCSVFDKCSGT